VHRIGIERESQDPAGGGRAVGSGRSFFAVIYGLLAIKQWSARERNLAVLSLMGAVFLLAYFLPFEAMPAGTKATGAAREALLMLQDYARRHVLLCLVPALFIAGAISCFVSQAAVMKYFGAQARKVVAYSVAAVSGTILAACSCTILPLFAGIYSRGAGIGPATAFLYSGPAINVLAIILTARVLGWQLGAARATGAIVFSLIIGLLMHLIYGRRQVAAQVEGGLYVPVDEHSRPLWQNAAYFAAMIGVLVFANWRALDSTGVGAAIASVKWVITAALLAVLVLMLARWFRPDELGEWVGATWIFAKQILPLLFAGVLVAGLLLGRPGYPALVPEAWIARSVGGNGLGANLFASVAGALMYFATLTEVPILEGLLGAGMGRGPALALLLAGPALSLPNMLVIRSVMGTQKTLVYVMLVVVLSTVAGMMYGSLAG